MTGTIFDRAATRALLAACAALVTLAAQAAAGPPVAPVRAVTDTYHGTSVTDNYRYFENLKDPEVQSWMHAQADYTRAALDRIPGRAALLERIRALADADTQRDDFVRRGDRYFYLLVERGAQQPKLVYRDGLGGAEHVLVDPEAMGAGTKTHYALDYFQPSWNGRLVAYGLSAGGSEASTLHVLKVEGAQVLGEAITRADNNTISWRADNASFFYLRYPEPKPGTPPSELEYNARSYLHVVGRNVAGDGDTVLFGRGVSRSVDVPEGQGTWIIGAPDSAYVVAVANHNNDDNPSTFFVAPLARLAGAATPWKRIAEVSDGITIHAVRGNTLYFLSQKGASRFRLLATPLDHPDVAHARVIVPEGRGVLTNFSFARDGIYYRERDGAGARLMRVAYAGGAAQAVPLPYEGNLFGPITDRGSDGALFNIEGWTQPVQLYTYDPQANASRNSGLLPPSSIDASGFESREVWVTSYDGTRVPLSILYRKGLKLDGSHPTIIDGYGSYGIVRETTFRPSRIAWLERGGVWAVAHIRGGGELGEEWHRGAFMRTKLNTVFDFNACAQYLVDAGYTSPARLGAVGGSAGGITVGGAMTWRPDLYRVILDHVGMSDTLRTETEPNGPPNTVEFGSIADEDGFHGLYAMGAYNHIHDGVAYPAVLFMTGANDPRVAPWHMMKMAARVQAASSSGRPALLRIDFDAGHGIGSNRSQGQMELADEWSFALWQMGEAGFQPPQ